MMRFLKFAFTYSWRNLLRHKRRTALTVATVAATLAFSLITSRYAVAVMDLWKNGAIDTGTAHVQLHKRGYWQKQEGVDPELMFQAPNDLEHWLDRRDDVEAWVRRLRFEGLIVADSGSTYFVGTAIDAEKELKVSPLMYNPPHDTGDFVSSPKRTSATIGRGLAKMLNLKIGDQATLLAQTGTGSVNAVDVDIVGIIDVPLPSFSKRAIYVNAAHAMRLLRLDDQYSEIAVRLQRHTPVEEWKEAVGKVANSESAEARVWWEIEPLIGKVEKIWNSVSGLLCFLLAISASLTVVNVIFMTVNERIVEIGTMMAVGAKPWMVRLIFGIEGALIGCVGGVLGSIVATAVIGIMAIYGIPFESPFGSGTEIVYPSVNLLWLTLAFFSAVGASALCSIPPANRAAKVDPVLAFRNLI